jgi:F-box-like
VQRDYQGFPPEVWIQIFPHILPDVQDVKNVTLTSKSFQLLAQPLLFQHISFRPYCVTSPTSGNLMSWQQDLAHINERLAFITLERIAHGVQDVDILPDVTFGRRQEGTVELSVIVDAVFRSLSRFPHLHALKCAQILFSQRHLAQLPCLSSSLETFTAVDCHIAAPLAEGNAPIVAVRDLTVLWGSMAPEVNGTASGHESSHKYWLSLMHPDFLRRLTLLPLSSHLHQMLSDVVTHGSVYRSLRSLKCSWYAVDSPYFLEVLGWFYLLCSSSAP